MKLTARLSALAAVAMLGMAAAATDARAYDLHIDPAKVQGPDACGECHKASVQAWRGTHHFSTFRDLARSKEAVEIAGKMGIRQLKTDSTCLSCHFTSKGSASSPDAIAGISCESCHGAGADYIKVHGDYGGKDVTKESESAAHRDQRLAKSDAAGMIRPDHLYALAENCYQCHTVPNEELVNKGGHAAGSAFELVAWSQGEMRHNVWYTKKNDEASAERKRMMFLIGQMLDLEYALRGVAEATQKANYAVTMAQRAQNATKRLAALAGLVSAPEIGKAAQIGSAASLKLSNKGPLTSAADQVKAQAQAFASKYDGGSFGAIDKYIPGSSKYKGSVIQPN